MQRMLQLFVEGNPKKIWEAQGRLQRQATFTHLSRANMGSRTNKRNTGIKKFQTLSYVQPCSIIIVCVHHVVAIFWNTPSTVYVWSPMATHPSEPRTLPRTPSKAHGSGELWSGDRSCGTLEIRTAVREPEKSWLGMDWTPWSNFS